MLYGQRLRIILGHGKKVPDGNHACLPQPYCCADDPLSTTTTSQRTNDTHKQRHGEMLTSQQDPQTKLMDTLRGDELLLHITVPWIKLDTVLSSEEQARSQARSQGDRHLRRHHSLRLAVALPSLDSLPLRYFSGNFLVAPVPESWMMKLNLILPPPVESSASARRASR